jgi:L-lactate dehydrogenase complex protein LldG
VNSRTEILGRVRAANARAARDVDVPRDYHRSAEPAATDALLDLLQDRLEDYRAQVHRVRHDAVPATVAEVVGERSIVVPGGLDPSWAPGATADDGGLTTAELDRFDGVVTACTAASAETGTIVLDGSADQGRRAITLVPDLHVCVVRAEQVVAGVPELVAAVEPTRPLTFISGPSATSDIELERVEGVHGPRTLVVLITT